MDDVSIPNQAPPPAAPQAPTQQYTVYTSANDISYEPELALKEGLGMVKTIRTSMQNLKVGSKLRQEVWLRELKSLEEETTPKTLIAVCGATGAGKSSLLNAVLDDNIVPTSGMRACTAVVTEIGYHDKNTIDADVSFLTEAEWRAELAVLLHDLVDEDGSLKRTTDLKSDAGVAWHKVSAVYPTLSQQKLVTMSVDQIIAYDRRVSQILGTTKVIVARNSKVFGAEIAKYIDSKEARGKKKDKKKEQEKVDGKSLMDKVREAAGNSRKKEKTDVNGPAFWPLVRQVNVRCKAACLSTGAILVDLPGVADANAARAGIAKNYMKKCQCIWVLAPITRAVDDKTARDLLGEAFKLQLMSDYDDHTITFIASKCDDISCSEVISALNLDDETELQDIEDEIERNEEETKERKEEKSNAVKLIKAIDLELKNLRPLLAEHQNHLEAIKQGIPFTPTLTASGKKNKSKNKKRKNNRSDKERSPKRRRSDDQDEFIISDDDDDEGNDTDISSTHSDEDDSASDSNKSDTDGGSDDESEKSEKSGDEEDDDEDEEEVVTEDFLKAKIDSAKEAIKEARARLNEARGQKKSANDRLDILKKEFGRIQRRKNAFCSLKRSEFSKEVLKEDFRTGLKDLDDAAAEERDPNNFDPTQNLRNYDAVNLPVFTCSSRDYVRLTGQVKGDGEPTCFTDKESTSIPALQSWCHTLTLSSRTRSSNMFYSHLRAFANSIKTYVHGIGDITAIDREYLREKWESNVTQGDGSLTGDDDDFDYARWGPIDFMDNPLAMSIGMDHLYAMPEPNPPQPKRNEHGQLAGVAPRLAREFSVVIDKSVKDLQAKFQDGLEDRCRVGAGQAAESALAISDEFAASMHWASYRATLRRHGSFRRDLNVELLAPFTRNIATTWGAIFEQDLFAPFGVDALAVINQLLEDVEASAALGLKDRVKTQGELCREEAKVAMQKSIEVVRNTLNSEQKEISRCLAPHVQSNLLDGYDLAMEERGTGSVARQKMVFHRYVAECKDDMFDDGADTLMDKLSDAAKAVGDVLDSNFGDLAKKIEVNLSVLWEPTQDDPRQVIARREMVDVVTSVLEQIDLWTQAAKDKREEVAAVQALLETDNDVDMN
ncbi:hypothetical protein K435DRAFT_883341 [Dendrothele bispora CBS 962.96]|uniref:P-loop containing nucleoside triphosphate hydrolase protein n=1 Tax=Dendrothele bispora (strain CBS 962.96) TaxID=1314807 RepID=A0A4S8MZK1_DENBC|nr:hypothetical protein K435DRAFT_883341 [Dendrothele bispora CBS 962.96]